MKLTAGWTLLIVESDFKSSCSTFKIEEKPDLCSRELHHNIYYALIFKKFESQIFQNFLFIWYFRKAIKVKNIKVNSTFCFDDLGRKPTLSLMLIKKDLSIKVALKIDTNLFLVVMLSLLGDFNCAYLVTTSSERKK